MFKLLGNVGKARLGQLTTAHGIIDTPAFMPVGTCGTVKALTPTMVESTKSQIILGNTYHLMLRPGDDIIMEAGGLRKFMKWSGPILTDSGGFQVMSLGNLTKISEQGVEFRSHIDGSKHMLTPERSTEIQFNLDSTISMVFDECPKFPISREDLNSSTMMSMRWAERSKKAFKQRDGFMQFGIMQGGVYKDLRQESARILTEIEFDGYALGGLAVGEGQELMFEVLDYAVDFLPYNKPRYLMGVGKPSDIIGAVKRGVDMFDCVLPTRSGRNGQVFTTEGIMNIRNSCYKNDHQILEEGCGCCACSGGFSRAYIHHLIKCSEILGCTLLTHHNVTYFQNLMQRIRKCVYNGSTIDFIS
jgi:queuine tRNA-ribosyltransferase